MNGNLQSPAAPDFEFNSGSGFGSSVCLCNAPLEHGAWSQGQEWSCFSAIRRAMGLSADDSEKEEGDDVGELHVLVLRSKER